MLIGCSLKMYFSHERSVEWTREAAGVVSERSAEAQGVRTFILPQYPSIAACAAAARGSGLAVGAQDLATEDEGAYTGEVSGRVLRELGCRYVEVGHAERRRLFGETEEVVAGKLAAAVRNSLVPILCVGEPEAGDAAAAGSEAIRQVAAVLGGLPEGFDGEIVVAYEPLWAIGAPMPASVEHIRTACGALQEYLAMCTRVRASVIYGGSAGPGLLGAIADRVDGLFLGRFAHDPQSFRLILDEALRIGGEGLR